MLSNSPLSPRPIPSRHRGRGFSLIEMLVSFVVLTLFVVMGVPTMNEAMRNAEVRNAAESLYNGLLRARTEAIRLNRKVSFYTVTANDKGVLDSSCKLSSKSAAWVITVDQGKGSNGPAGDCGASPDESASPYIIAKWAPNDGAIHAVVQVKERDCATDATDVHTTFDGFGRVGRNASPPMCYVVTHANGADAARPLHVRIRGSSVSLCDPDQDLPAGDPRRCPAFAAGTEDDS
ncbi:Tfp pilus assembly protein FimT/FimU [Roseateles sp. BYS180W]|uniref:Type II secretion system protein H n=1 Tax=Roseateles rivi TaxID=3299028 RepID=A0ABW7FU37_9BURK